MVTCSKCGNPSGNQSYCKGCRKVYIREHYLKNRRAYLDANKRRQKRLKAWVRLYKEQNKLCFDCKRTDLPACCYEFDHFRDKIKPVSKLVNNSLKKVKEEIEKCVIVCRNCHKERTYRKYQQFEPRKTSNKLIIAKRSLINKLKSNPCSSCNESYPYWVMELDHVRGNKNCDIKVMMYRNYSISKLLEELMKVEVVCSNCHNIRTMERNQY